MELWPDMLFGIKEYKWPELNKMFNLAMAFVSKKNISVFLSLSLSLSLFFFPKLSKCERDKHVQRQFVRQDAGKMVFGGIANLEAARSKYAPHNEPRKSVVVNKDNTSHYVYNFILLKKEFVTIP